MGRIFHSLGSFTLPCALALLCGGSGTAQAETITFVNETKATLVVQMATAVRGGLRRDRPYQVAPGEKIKITLPGNKLVNIYDARNPNRPLYQGTLNASLDDQNLAIKPGKPDALGLPRLSLEVIKPPPPNPPPRGP